MKKRNLFFVAMMFAFASFMVSCGNGGSAEEAAEDAVEAVEEAADDAADAAEAAADAVESAVDSTAAAVDSMATDASGGDEQ